MHYWFTYFTKMPALVAHLIWQIPEGRSFPGEKGLCNETSKVDWRETTVQP